MKTVQIATAKDDVAVVLVSQGESGVTEVFEDGVRMETTTSMGEARRRASERQVARAMAACPGVPADHFDPCLSWKTEAFA